MMLSLGDRIKLYEHAYRIYLPPRLPLLLRLDGCHFHTYTQGLTRPVDDNLVSCINDTAKYLCANIQGAQIAYIQSDEISILLNNYTSLDSEAWYQNNLQKMVSVSAAMASAVFTSISGRIFGGTSKIATFDCRAFIVPKEDVNNTFLWRQQDATRNSIQMLARSLFSHKECDNKNGSQLQELCHSKGVNWNDCSTSFKRGRCVIKRKVNKSIQHHQTGETIEVMRSEWVIDNEIPIFSQDTNYIEQYINSKEIDNG